MARLAVTLKRKFVLYVCATQDQADHHVQAISSLLESAGVERRLGKYGNSKGWRREQLRTKDGFNVAGIGLDKATRGVKLDEFRPDLIILDDIDSQDDTPKTVAKKLASLQKAIIPAGSFDCAVLFVQNLIHEESIMTQLVEERADFLHDRETPFVEKAVEGLEVEKVRRPEDGRFVYKVLAGKPTWAGQNLATIERQINDWGYRVFLSEAQHEVTNTEGYFFDIAAFQYVQNLPLNLNGWKFCRAWDLAATQGGGDYTVGLLMALSPQGIYYIVDIVRGQLNSNKVRTLILDTAIDDKRLYGLVTIRLPQDPAQAGKYQAEQLREDLKGFPLVKIKPITGRKGTRARGLADEANGGNVVMVGAEDQADENASLWHRDLRLEYKRFREDETHDFDDQIDAGADAYNELFTRPKAGWGDFNKAHATS